MATADGFADAVERSLREVNGRGDADEILRSIVEVAAANLPGLEHVGVSLAHRDGRIETVARSDDLVRRLDSLQYEFGEGPCLHTVQAGATTVVEHLRHDQRWPRFVPAAARLGLRSQLAVRLYDDQQIVGGLNLYSTTSDTIDHDTVRLAELFATHAAYTLGHRRTEDELREALATRRTIGIAIGMLMERHGIDEHAAFRFLVRVSSTTNTKLREVAERLVAEPGHRER